MALKNLQVEERVRESVARKMIDAAKGADPRNRELAAFFQKMAPKTSDYALTSSAVEAIIIQLNTGQDILSRETENIEGHQRTKSKLEGAIKTLEALLAGEMGEAETREWIQKLEALSAKGTSEEFKNHVDFCRLGSDAPKTARYIAVLDRLAEIEGEIAKCENPEQHEAIKAARAAVKQAVDAITQHNGAMGTTQTDLVRAREDHRLLEAEIAYLDEKSGTLESTIRGKILSGEASDTELGDLEREQGMLLATLATKTQEKIDNGTRINDLESDLRCMTDKLKELETANEQATNELIDALKQVTIRSTELETEKVQLMRERVRLIPLVEAERVISSAKEKIEATDTEIRKCETIVSEQKGNITAHEAALQKEVNNVVEGIIAKLSEAAKAVMKLTGNVPLLMDQGFGALEAAVDRLGVASDEIAGRAENLLRSFFSGDIARQVQAIINEGMGLTGKADIDLVGSVRAIVSSAVAGTEDKMRKGMCDLYAEIQGVRRTAGLQNNDQDATNGGASGGA